MHVQQSLNSCHSHDADTALVSKAYLYVMGVFKGSQTTFAKLISDNSLSKLWIKFSLKLGSFLGSEVDLFLLYSETPRILPFVVSQ